MNDRTNARANPLALGPLSSRVDVQRAVLDLYEPLLPHVSPGGALVRLGSFSALFPDRVAELEGFARPLYGIVPLTVGGGDFPYWDRIVAGLDAGTDPDSAEYWGPVSSSPDQRMVEQAAIGLALAFCPEQTWEPLSPGARSRLVTWLHGIFDHEPVANNWQFFRVLVALGLERVGAPFDASRVTSSLEMIDSFRRGEHGYIDGQLANVDYYVPFAFHTYGLMYVAASKLGLGDPGRAQAFAERAAGFAQDFVHWFGPDGAAIPYGRSLTYRFAMGSFWGALAWADVEAIGWDVAKGMSMRHLRWWAERPISDRDGVVSVGYGYDNRRLAESYNSAGSPYWCMKFFAGLAAAGEHPFWSSAEAAQPVRAEPVGMPDTNWVVQRDADQAVALVGRVALPISMLEQTAAKYDKFAYSSVFGFSGDLEAAFGMSATDSMLTLTDDDGTRRTRLGAVAGGVESEMAWSTWFPWPDVRVDTVLWGGSPWHGRIHRIRSARSLRTAETGFALPMEPTTTMEPPATGAEVPGRAVVVGPAGCSAIVESGDGSSTRASRASRLPANANLVASHTKVPILAGELTPGDHQLACLVFASPSAAGVPPAPSDAVPETVIELLGRISAAEHDPPPAEHDFLRLITARATNP